MAAVAPGGVSVWDLRKMKCFKYVACVCGGGGCAGGGYGCPGSAGRQGRHAGGAGLVLQMAVGVLLLHGYGPRRFYLQRQITCAFPKHVVLTQGLSKGAALLGMADALS